MTINPLVTLSFKHVQKLDFEINSAVNVSLYSMLYHDYRIFSELLFGLFHVINFSHKNNLTSRLKPLLT